MKPQLLRDPLTRSVPGAGAKLESVETELAEPEFDRGDACLRGGVSIALFELDAVASSSVPTSLEHPLAGEEIVGEVEDDEEDPNDHRHHHHPVQHPEKRVPGLAAAEKPDHSGGNGAAGPGMSAMPIS